MRLLIAAVGSTGDVAPYLGLGLRLRAEGHQVAIATHRRFAGLVAQSGLVYRELPGDPLALYTSTTGQRWQRAGTGVRGVAAYGDLVAAQLPALNHAIVAAAGPGADMLLLSTGALGGYHAADSLGLATIGVPLQPLLPTREFPPVALATLPTLGGWGNLAGYALAGLIVTRRLGGVTGRLRADLGLPPESLRGALARVVAMPTYYGYSPTVAGRPADWPVAHDVVGYFPPFRPPDWRPSPDLVDFLAGGPPPVFVGFGSMCPGDPAALSATVAAALRQAGMRGVVQSGWAGLSARSADLITIDEVPHEWLFPQMAAVVHHAGAGTTAAGLRAGAATVPVPVTADQRYWSRQLCRHGASPGYLPMRRLTADRLAAALHTAVTDVGYRTRAAALGRRIDAEDGAGRVAGLLARCA